LSENLTPNAPTDESAAVAPDPAAALGAVAYGLFVLNDAGPLAEIATLDESSAARIPAQEGRSFERDLFQEKLLGELGALDL
jgi:hypothetical protein